MIERHDARLRRTARRYSLCSADADDAYQRALEILLRKAPDVGPQRLLRWMHTVTRHEASAVRRQRERLLDSNRTLTEDGTEVDTIDLFASEAPEPDVGAERSERVRRGFEALRSLKPQEIRALTLKAEGYSYDEIAEITGFSKTKINRCMVEGRRHFLEAFSDIEEGERCEQLSADLSAFADGELAEADGDLKIHLASCAHCMAKLREYRAVPKRVLSLAPVVAMGGPSVLARAGDRFHETVDRLRDAGASLMPRGSGVIEASQGVAAGGGTRGSGLALIGVVCGIGAAGGGAAYCVDQGALPSPLGQGKPVVEKQAESANPESAVEASPDQAPLPAAPDPIAEPARREPPPQREFAAPSGSPGSGGTREFSSPAPAPSSPSGGGAGGGSSGKESFGL